MRLLVCGGRDYRDQKHIDDVLNHIHAKRPITRLIHGDASGADTCGASWGRRNIGADRVDPYPADWTDTSHPGAVIRWRNGKAYDAKAGHRRNARMLMLGCPDLVLAFPGGAGTGNMIGLARRAGVEVHLDIVAMDGEFDGDRRLSASPATTEDRT